MTHSVGLNFNIYEHSCPDYNKCRIHVEAFFPRMSPLWFLIGFGIQFLVVMLHDLPLALVHIKLHMFLLANIVLPSVCYLHAVILWGCAMRRGIHFRVVILDQFLRSSIISIYTFCFSSGVRKVFSCYLHVVRTCRFWIYIYI